jgi:hypothetical protein
MDKIIRGVNHIFDLNNLYNDSKKKINIEVDSKFPIMQYYGSLLINTHVKAMKFGPLQGL